MNEKRALAHKNLATWGGVGQMPHVAKINHPSVEHKSEKRYTELSTKAMHKIDK